VCVVTGATSGIGRATVAEFVSRSARVIGVCRDAASAGAYRRQLAALGNAQAVCVEIADLSRPAAVTALASRIVARDEHVRVLVNTAGVQRWTRHETRDGIELTLATNVLAPFLLTECLVPALERGRGQVIDVASTVHRWGRIDWHDLQKVHGYDPHVAYAQSKLALMLIAFEGARRYGARGIRVNAVHPGMTRTAFGRDFRGLSKLVTQLSRPLQRRPVDVAREIGALAFEPHFDRLTGAYLVRGRVTAPAERETDAVAAARLWNMCEQLTMNAVGDRTVIRASAPTSEPGRR
jgi:NAD(P)-dependent dehydrogenase (short-subunit alcohol dehydrogenase family)